MAQLVITLMLFLAFFGTTACIVRGLNKNLEKFCWIMVGILVVSLMVVTIVDAIVNYGNTPLPCR